MANSKIKIRGAAAVRMVSIDGVVLNPTRSQKVFNHSPDGFSWGYGGSGPAQLALAVMLHVNGGNKEAALSVYQEFKRQVVAALPMDKDFEIEVDPEKWKR